MALYRPPVDEESHLTNFQSGTVTSTGNLLSSTTFDFTSLNAITSPTAPVPALSANPPGFAPGGFPGRVDMATNAAGQLLGVYEVSLTQPLLLTNGEVEVKARLLFQPSSLSANNETELTDPANLRMLVRGEELLAREWPVAVSNNVATFRYTPGKTNGRDEVVIFLDPLQSSDFDEDRQAWSSAELLLGATLRFERTPDVADDRRLSYGTVRVTRSGPLANLNVLLAPAAYGYVTRPARPDGPDQPDYELRTATGALISLDANGRWPVTIPAGATEVTLRVQPRPGTEDILEYEAAYLQLVPDEAYAIAPPGPWTTVWDNRYVGSAVAVTLWDGPKYRLYALSDFYPYDGGGGAGFAAAAGATSADAASSPAPVPETDPPTPGDSPQDAQVDPLLLPLRVTRLPIDAAELDPDGGLPIAALQPEAPEPPSGPLSSASTSYLESYQTAAYAINSLASPAVGGYALYYNNVAPQLPMPYFTLGGVWLSPAYNDLLHRGSPWVSPIIYGVDEGGNVVGSYNARPCFGAAGSTNVITLPSITTGQNGEALWITPTNGLVAGWSYYRTNSVNYQRPTRWLRDGQGVWQAVDLGSFDGSPTTLGYAYMANDTGVVVGKARYPVSGTNAWRAFRTAAGQGIVSTNASELWSPDRTNLPPLLNCTANGVNGTGDSVGGSDAWFSRTNSGVNWKVETRAVLWWAGEQTARVLPSLQPVDPDPAKWPGRSEAFAVSRSPGKITAVGSSWATPSGSGRAFLVDVYDTSGAPGGWRDLNAAWSLTLNLNDPHLTYKPSSWTMTTAEAINDNGWIVGNGGLNYNQGWVLVPQSFAGQ